MRRRILTCVVVFSSCVLADHLTLEAAGRSSKSRIESASAAVEQVLRREVAGPVDRRELLAPAVQEAGQSPAARWQSGFVLDGSDWRSFDEARVSVPALAEYERRRSLIGDTQAEQVQLADWCRKQKLFDQERAHLFAALAAPPRQRDPAILERLGYELVGQQWLSPEQLQDWARDNQQAQDSLKQFGPRLERLAQRAEGKPGQRDAAFRELLKIQEPGAVRAIEFVLAGREEVLADWAVQVLQQIKGPGASLALARQAVFSPWESVRPKAAAALKDRKFDDYVPALLGLLATPGETQFAVFQDPARGGLTCQFALAVETSDAQMFQTSTLQIVMPTVTSQFGVRGNNRQLTGLQAGAALQNSAALQRAQLEATRLARDEIQNRVATTEALNDRIRELNSRVVSVLATVSGQSADQDPRSWWKWWQTTSDTHDPYGKERLYYSEESQVATAPVLMLSIGRYDCLAAGTPVRTENGLRPIEEIRAGDRVLSQNVETGELAYKPVLHTTIRPPRELWSVRVGSETLVGTGGHRFFKSGEGWVKTRELQAQDLLHTVTGNVPIWTARPGETAQTYNLVVADFHTYFVGQAGILSQDVLAPRPTNNLVPGLSREHAVADPRK